MISKIWIPAKAGMAGIKCGNDTGEDDRFRNIFKGVILFLFIRIYRQR
jgi:hypothetical protein